MKLKTRQKDIVEPFCHEKKGMHEYPKFTIALPKSTTHIGYSIGVPRAMPWGLNSNGSKESMLVTLDRKTSAGCYSKQTQLDSAMCTVETKLLALICSLADSSMHATL